MLDLSPCRGVKDSKASINMPFIRVDPECDVDFYVFDPGRPSGGFPGELTIGVPGGTHAEEGGVGNGLGVRSNAVVFGGRKVDGFAAEAAEDFFN